MLRHTLLILLFQLAWCQTNTHPRSFKDLDPDEPIEAILAHNKCLYIYNVAEIYNIIMIASGVWKKWKRKVLEKKYYEGLKKRDELKKEIKELEKELIKVFDKMKKRYEELKKEKTELSEKNEEHTKKYEELANESEELEKLLEQKDKYLSFNEL